MVVGPKLAVGDIGGNVIVIVVDDSENNIYYFMLLVFSKEHKYITKSQAIGIRIVCQGEFAVCGQGIELTNYL